MNKDSSLKFPDKLLSMNPVFSLTYYLKLLLICLFINIFVFPQSIPKQIKAGLELGYNFQWQKAEELFEKIIHEHSEKPDGYHFLSSVYLWYYLGSRNKNDFDDFLKYSDKAIDLAKEALENKSQNAYLNYLLGTNYMYRAVAFTREENYLDAVWASKKSEYYLTETLRIDPKFVDAYLGLGLYNFAMGQIPSAFQWALSLAGIKGDKQVGIDYIKKAAAEGNLAKVEAQYYLSQILTEILFENEAALYYLKNLIRKYPQNLLFNYSYAVAEIKQRKLSDAQRVLYKLVYLENERFSQIISFSNFLMGDVFFRRNMFDSAKVYYLAFLKNTPTIDYTGIASLRLGLAFELADDRKTAEKFYKGADDGNMDLEDDQFAKRKSELYLKKALSSSERSLIKISNMIEAGSYNDALDSINNLLPNLKNGSLLAEIYLYLSEVLFLRNEYDESLSAALTALESNPKEEKWIIPFACYYAARAYLAKNNKLKFEEYIEKIDDYSDYDYQNKLKNLVFSLSMKK